MKKLFILCALLATTQAFSFPNLLDYEVKKEIYFQDNGIQQIMMFDDPNSTFKLSLLNINGHVGYQGTCPITGYVVFFDVSSGDLDVSSDGSTVMICDPDANFEKSRFIKIDGDANTAYFEGGYLTTMKCDDSYYSLWVQYVN